MRCAATVAPGVLLLLQEERIVISRQGRRPRPAKAPDATAPVHDPFHRDISDRGRRSRRHYRVPGSLDVWAADHRFGGRALERRVGANRQRSTKRTACAADTASCARDNPPLGRATTAARDELSSQRPDRTGARDCSRRFPTSCRWFLGDLVTESRDAAICDQLSPHKPADQDSGMLRLPGFSLMELAGLEPATSWVRSRRSPN